jgi:1-deoxy-D-xylulose-5-phosphate reductoisomerase
LNAANEVVVEEFLKDSIGFLDMTGIIEETMGTVALIQNPALADYEETDREARIVAKGLMRNR